MESRIKELETAIAEANWKYWVDCNPSLTDVEYDSMVEELRSLDPTNKALSAFSFQPSAKKVVHSVPMLSLDKAYSLDEVLKWAKKYARGENEEFLVMPKYDGLSGKLENGQLSSRGDGRNGQDYTDRLPIVKFLRAENAPKVDCLLGEMLITDGDFQSVVANIKSKSGITFKNQRNAAAGIIGCDEVKYYSKYGKIITFVDYDYVSWKVSLKEFANEWEKIVLQIQALPFPMDGIVIKLKDKEYASSLGATEHAPRGAIAFKYTNSAKWTKLVGIEWSMGKDQIAAIGKVDPVDITGITIQNVKLQLTKPVDGKAAYLLDGSLQIGDEVLIERAGDIIPHVKESKPGSSRTRVTLDRCPFCGGPLRVSATSIECADDNCETKVINRLRFSMVALDFKRVGEKYAENLFNLLGVRTTGDLMKVTKSDLKSHSEFGDKMADIFLEEQAKAKVCSKEQFLVSLNVSNLGKSAAKLLVENFPFEQIIAGELTYSDLITVKGIGKVAAEAISSELRMSSQKIKEAASLFSFKTESQPVGNGGEKICFTGKMEHSRKEMEKMAEAAGLTPVDHVDKETKILVCADPNSGSSKMKKAKDLGCIVMSEADFYQKYVKAE